MAFDGREQLYAPSAGVHLIDGLPLLRPSEKVFTATFHGWHNNQQPSRNLTFSTIKDHEKAERTFTAHAFPCTWTPQPEARYHMNTDHLNSNRYQ